MNLTFEGCAAPDVLAVAFTFCTAVELLHGFVAGLNGFIARVAQAANIFLCVTDKTLYLGLAAFESGTVVEVAASVDAIWLPWLAAIE